MRLGQERQPEFFEIDQVEDVENEIFEFGVKPFNIGDILHEIVVMFEEFAFLHHLGEFAFDVSLTGKIRRADRHIDVFAFCNRRIQSRVERIAFIETHIMKFAAVLETLFDVVYIGVGEVQIKGRNLGGNDKFAYLVRQMGFPRARFGENQGVFPQYAVVEFEIGDRAFKVSDFSFHDQIRR